MREGLGTVHGCTSSSGTVLTDCPYCCLRIVPKISFMEEGSCFEVYFRNVHRGTSRELNGGKVLERCPKWLTISNSVGRIERRLGASNGIGNGAEWKRVLQASMRARSKHI